MKPSHIIVLVIVILVVFGASKLPEIAKSIGQSAKILKKEMRELNDDGGTPGATGDANAAQNQVPYQNPSPTDQQQQTGPSGGNQQGQSDPPA